MKKNTFIIAIIFLMTLAALVTALLIDTILSSRRAIGIIGGADDPTSILVGESVKVDQQNQQTIEDEEYDVDSQLAIIAKNKDMWLPDLEYADEICRYAVTDLDRNGRLEMIVSNHGGTGLYTYSRFFEVNESFDALAECETDFPEGDSQPDLLLEETLNTYIDSDDVFHYAVYDVLKNGAAEYYENYRALKLKDGKITTVPIAYKTTLYDPQNVTCTDANGNEISEEEFAEAPDRYFAGCQKTVTTLGWQDVKELDTEIEKIKEQIRISEKIFANLTWED